VPTDSSQGLNRARGHAALAREERQRGQREADLDHFDAAPAASRAICRARPTLGLEHFRVHDLRRTGATGMAALGVNPHTISLVLDHIISVTKGTVTGAVYVKYSFDREKRDALERWASHLQRLIG
jgi:integrase